MKDILFFKDFIGTVHYSTDDETFYGKIEGINDLVTFEGNSVRDLKSSFEEAVEDYIELCQLQNKEIFKSFKGSFNVRISPDLHKKAVQKSQVLGISLNQFVEKAIDHELTEAK